MLKPIKQHWYQLGNFRGRLGRRLLLASAGLLCLMAFTGAIGFITTYTLGSDMQVLVEDSVPAILESNQLEQEASRLQRQAQQLVEADDLVSIATRQGLIEQSLQRMSAAAKLLTEWYPQQAPALAQQIQVSRAAAEALASAAQQHQADLSGLRMLKMRIEWLHDDLDSELRLLSEEHHIELEQSHRSQKTLHELRVLEQLSQGERDATKVMLALSTPRDEGSLAPIFKQLHSDVAQLLTWSQALPAEQSGSLRELLDALQKVARTDGELNTTLVNYSRSASQMRQRLAHLEQQLALQNQQAEKLSHLGRSNAQQHLQQSLVASQRGRWLVTLASLAAMGLMLWILFGLIGHRVIARLALLGQDMDAIARGIYILPQPPTGSDEIAQLGQQVHILAHNMAELERTNALALIEHTDAALLICDQAGRVVSINQAARRFCPTLQVGEPLLALWPEDMRPNLAGLHGDDVVDMTLPFGDLADENYLRLLARIFQQKNADYVMVTLFDVSAQMRSAYWLSKMVAEKTAALDESNAALRAEIDGRKRAQDSLVQATKFAVLGQTTTSLAHELNQPLAALTNYLYLAKKSAEQCGDSDLQQTLLQSDKVTERMARLIRSYRTLGRAAPESPALYPVDISQVLSDIIELLQGRIRQQQVQVILPHCLATWVRGEVVRLEQITLNLLGNALDAMLGNQSARLELALQQNDGRLELLVMDNGAGLSPSSVNELFQPFYTTKADGLGLGLSICQSLASECHAQIRMASQISGGAIFILSMEPSHAT